MGHSGKHFMIRTHEKIKEIYQKDRALEKEIERFVLVVTEGWGCWIKGLFLFLEVYCFFCFVFLMFEVCSNGRDSLIN